MKIKQETMEFILQACRNTYPNEFMALLQQRDDVIQGIMVIPGSKFEKHSSTLMRHMVPMDQSIVGSVHSHPGPPIPSEADLRFFAKQGRIHIIIGQPYTIKTTRAFTQEGNPTQLEIVK